MDGLFSEGRKGLFELPSGRPRGAFIALKRGIGVFDHGFGDFPPPPLSQLDGAARLGLDANATSEAIEMAREMSMPAHVAAAAIYIAARNGRRLTIEEAAEAAGVSAQALERRLRELRVRPIYTRARRPSEKSSKAKKPAKEMAILGPYVLTKARRKGSNFALRGVLALELAYNLREAGVIADAKLAEVEEIARGRVAWYISVGRLALMELGAEFVKPEKKGESKDEERA